MIFLLHCCEEPFKGPLLFQMLKERLCFCASIFTGGIRKLNHTYKMEHKKNKTIRTSNTKRENLNIRVKIRENNQYSFPISAFLVCGVRLFEKAVVKEDSDKPLDLLYWKTWLLL